MTFTSINRWYWKDEILREGDNSIFDCLEIRTLVLANDENFPSIKLSSKLSDTESSPVSSNV
jgi:hypothetical protein